MTADDKVTRSLEKLKLASKKPEMKRPRLFKDISEMDFEAKPDQEKERQISSKEEKIEDISYARKIEVMMRKIEEILSKMSAGSNYLMYYGQMQELENEFLEMVNGIEEKKDKFPPQLYNRIIFKKQNIMNKRKK
ncbi:MAG: hypothetical protein AABW41_01930 [Nanoarchaeota archaeon]